MGDVATVPAITGWPWPHKGPIVPIPTLGSALASDFLGRANPTSWLWP